MGPQPGIDKKSKNQDNLLSLCLKIDALPQPSKLSETLQGMSSAPIYCQHFTAPSINDTSYIYKAFVFQHSLIYIEPTRFESIYGNSAFVSKTRISKGEKKIKI